jgi:hypothetical protein
MSVSLRNEEVQKKISYQEKEMHKGMELTKGKLCWANSKYFSVARAEMSETNG